MELLMSSFVLLVLNFGLIVGQNVTTPKPQLTFSVGNLEELIKAEITRQVKEVTKEVNKEIIKQEVTKQVQETNNELIKDEVSRQVKERANQHLSDGVTKLDLLADRLQPLERLADGVQELVKEQTTRGNMIFMFSNKI